MPTDKEVVEFGRVAQVRVRGYRHVMFKNTRGGGKFLAEKYSNDEGTRDTLQEAAQLADERIRTQKHKPQEVNIPCLPGEQPPSVLLKDAGTRGWVYDPLLNEIVYDLSEDGCTFVVMPRKQPKTAVTAVVYCRARPRSMYAVPMCSGTDSIPEHIFLVPAKSGQYLELDEHQGYLLPLAVPFPRQAGGGVVVPAPAAEYQGCEPDEGSAAECQACGPDTPPAAYQGRELDEGSEAGCQGCGPDTLETESLGCEPDWWSHFKF